MAGFCAVSGKGGCWIIVVAPWVACCGCSRRKAGHDSLSTSRGAGIMAMPGTLRSLFCGSHESWRR
jgi:hypothetical protein